MSKNKKIITIFHLKIIIFTAGNNRCILHGRVIVMCTAYALELAGTLNTGFLTRRLINVEFHGVEIGHVKMMNIL